MHHADHIPTHPLAMTTDQLFDELRGYDVNGSERRKATDAHREKVARGAATTLETWGGDYPAAAECAERLRDRQGQTRVGFWADVATLLRRRADTLAGGR